MDQINQYINNNDNYPDVKWGTMHQIENMFGEVTWQPASSKMGTALSVDMCNVISVDTAQPEKVARLLDYAKYDEDLIRLVNWGIEGETYTVNEDGSFSYIDEIANAPSPAEPLAQYGLSTGCRSGIVLMPQMSDAVSAQTGLALVYEDGEYGTDTIYEFGDRVNGDRAIAPYEQKGAPVVTFTEDENDEISRIKTPIDTYVAESMAKFMVGEWKVEEQWDQFIDTIRSMGDIQSVVDLYNSKVDK